MTLFFPTFRSKIVKNGMLATCDTQRINFCDFVCCMVSVYALLMHSDGADGTLTYLYI